MTWNKAAPPSARSPAEKQKAMAFSANPLPNPPTSRTDDTQSRIQAIWQQNLPALRSRLDLLAAVAQSPTISDPEREEAISIAHKLAGSLGLFGFPEGTDLARQLEAALSAPALQPGELIQLTTQLRTTLHLAA